MLDIRTAGEDPLQVHPPTLDVYPHVKQRVYPVQPVLPGEGVVLKHLEVGRELHGRHGVDVLLDLCEEVVPASYDAAFVLVVDQVQLVGLPGLSDLKWVGKTLPCSDFKVLSSKSSQF